ncbi:hypothetical protein [Pedobacter miscanthi]|uniref:hypothetical protein n=1 Tax=Pedobacter miscanthi TaxID=2259170 RepID=UPI00292D7619|nr:hypothetical protein [Pedobacter miscanthi]
MNLAIEHKFDSVAYRIAKTDFILRAITGAKKFYLQKNLVSIYLMKYSVILNDVNNYLLKEFNYKRPFAVFGLNENLIYARQKRVDLYLRFFEQGDIRKHATIIIARIGFAKTRNGKGKHLMRFLLNLAITHKYEFIELECCNEDSAGFAKAIGFYPLDSKGLNWRIGIRELHQYYTKFHKELKN